MKTAKAHNAPHVGHYEAEYVTGLKASQINTGLLERLFEALGIKLVVVSVGKKSKLCLKTKRKS